MLLLESKNISEAEMGEWLRRIGLHSEHPGLWEQELRTLVDQKGGDKSREMKEIRKELKKRDKELNRKDKALAEMSTIIALQGCRGRVPHRSVKKQIVSDIKEAVTLEGFQSTNAVMLWGFKQELTTGGRKAPMISAQVRQGRNAPKMEKKVEYGFRNTFSLRRIAIIIHFQFSILNCFSMVNGGNVSSPVYPANCTEIARYANGRKYAYYYI